MYAVLFSSRYLLIQIYLANLLSIFKCLNSTFVRKFYFRLVSSLFLIY